MIELRKMVSWDRYLPGLLLSQLGLQIGAYHIDPIETGMMNYVFRVRTDKGIFFLKQALPRAKADRALGPALRTLSSHRLEYEKNCLSEIEAIRPDGVRIPTVYHYDTHNHILLLGDVAGKEGQLLETSLLSGAFDAPPASAVGRFLGVMHRRTWGVPRSIRGSRQNDLKNWVHFLDMRTKGITANGVQPEIMEGLDKLYAVTLQRHSHDVLIWMDGCPKNVVVRKDCKIGVLDFELASGVGDPAYDLGFFIGHYLIHALLQNRMKPAMQAIAGSIQSYCNEIKGMPFEDRIMKRVVKFMAATIIYRIAGASRLKYIQPQAAQDFLKKAAKLLWIDLRGDQDKVLLQVANALA